MLPATYLAQLRALVIDDQQSMRSALREALTDAQIRDIHTTGTAESAVSLIRSMRFGLVLSDYNLGPATDGQQLLEYLRAHALLPPDALFFLVTGEASQDRVVCAGEQEPDGFIVKPITPSTLLERIEEALERQAGLQPLNAAVAAGDWPRALDLCEKMRTGGSRWPLRVQRIKARALGELGRWDEALGLYRAVQGVRNLHWAEFGIARCLAVMGDAKAARAQLQTLLASRPYHSPANELMVTLLEREGELVAATDVAQAAAQMIPTAQRERRLAQLALRDGRIEVAERAASRLVQTTARSITRDVADTGLLAEVHLARGAPQAALEVANRLDGDEDPRAAGVRAAIAWQAGTALGDDAGAQRARDALERSLADAHDVRSGLLVAKAALAASLNEPAVALLARIAPAGIEGDAVRTQARELLKQAGLSDALAAFSADTENDAVRDVDQAVELLRGGRYAEAQALARKAEAAAPHNTRVLQEAADIYLLSMRMLGMDEALLARCSVVMDRLRARGTANPARLEKMTTFLQRLRDGERVA